MRVEKLTPKSFLPAWPFMRKHLNGHCPEEALLPDALASPNVALLAAYRGQDTIGIAVAGNVTARGLIADFATTDEPAVKLLLHMFCCS